MTNRTGCRSCTESTQCPSCRRRRAPMSPIGMQFMQAAADTTTGTNRRVGSACDASSGGSETGGDGTSPDTGSFCGD